MRGATVSVRGEDEVLPVRAEHRKPVEVGAVGDSFEAAAIDTDGWLHLSDRRLPQGVTLVCAGPLTRWPVAVALNMRIG